MLKNDQKRIPKQTLLGGELHNLAYITPAESEVLRGLGGGVTPSGGQMMSRGVPAYQGASYGMQGLKEAAQKKYIQDYKASLQNYQARLKPAVNNAVAGAGIEQIEEFKAAQAAQQELIDAQTAGYKALPAGQRKVLYGGPDVDYRANPALGLMYQLRTAAIPRQATRGNSNPGYSYSMPYNDTIFRTERGAGIGAPSIVSVNTPGGTRYEIGPGAKWSRASGGPSLYRTYEEAQKARDAELLGKYEAGLIDLDTGLYLDPDPRTRENKEVERPASNFDLSASNVGSARYGDTGTGLMLSPEESALANQSFRSQLLGEQNRVISENAGLNLLQSGLIG